MATDRVESSQSPEIALLWPLQEVSPTSTSDPAKMDTASPWRPPVKRRKVSSASSPTRRNRTSTARSSAEHSSNSSGTYQDPLYAHLRPQPQPEAASRNSQDVLEDPIHATVHPSLSQTSSRRFSQGEPYYFPDNLSDIVVPNTPITFEKAFSQQVKETRVGSTSSSSRTLTQIPIGGFSTLNATGAVTSRQGTVGLKEVEVTEKPSTASSASQSSSLNVPYHDSQRHVLVKTDLNSPVKRAAAATASGLPTPPFSDVKRSKQAESEDEHLEAELKDLRKATAKYGILTPPSSSTGRSDAQCQGARAETIDPFNAIYDDIEVESMSEDENQTVQAGRPLTHPKAREARMQALNKLKKSRVRSDIPASVSPNKSKRRRERSNNAEHVVSVSECKVGTNTESGITPPPPSLKRRKRAKILPSSQPDDGDDFMSIRAENSRQRSITLEHLQSVDDAAVAILNTPGGIRSSQPDPDILDEGDEGGVLTKSHDDMQELIDGDREPVSKASSAIEILEESEPGEEAESSPEQPVVKRRPRQPLLVSSQASSSGDDKADETDTEMLPHEGGSVDLDPDTGTLDHDLSTMFDNDDVEEADVSFRSEFSKKVKSEKVRGKQPDYDMTVLSDDDDEQVPIRQHAFAGDNFVDLTEDDVEGDAYEVDKYERTQEPVDDDDQGSSIDDFDAFDWDPSQPIVEAAPSVDATRPSKVPMAMPTVAADGEELVHPLRMISSLPEKLQHFYLTHWCRESTRKKGLVGTEAQLANDKLVHEEMEAASAKRSGKGKTWASTVAARSGRGGAGANGSTRGGRGAARGKAFFIQRALRAKRAGRGRGRG